MQTEQEQQKFVDEYIEEHNVGYNKKSWNNERAHAIEDNYNSHKFPYPDLINPIDGGSKVECAYWYTKLYPLRMHDKLTNKDYFIKKGVQEKYFPKRYYLTKNADFVDRIKELYDKNGIKSLVIKPSMMAQSEGIMKINQINPYQKFKNKKLDQESFQKANGNIMDLIEKQKKDAQWFIGKEHLNGCPFKGVFSGSIIYEENLNPNKDGFLDDYKFWCVNGEPIFCEVISGRKNHTINVAFIDENKQRLPLNHKRQRNMTEQELKDVLKECSDKSYKEMMEVAKKASKGLPLIRIDFCLNEKGEPKFIEAQDLYNYHINSITMDDVRCAYWYILSDGNLYPVNEEKRNYENIRTMAKKFKLDPKAFTEENCKIYNNETKKEEQISSFEKMIGNLIDLTQIDEKDIGNLPYENPEEAKKKEEEAKIWLKKMKALNNGLNVIKKTMAKHAFNEHKTAFKLLLKEKNEQQKEEEKLKQMTKNVSKKNPNKSKAPLKPVLEGKNKRQKEEQERLKQIRKAGYNEHKTAFQLWLEKKNKQQKEEKEKLKQIRKNIRPYIPVDSKRFLQVQNPHVGGNRIKFKGTQHQNYLFLPSLKYNVIGGKKPGVYNLNNKQPVKSK